jgi:hypothetical protein
LIVIGRAKGGLGVTNEVELTHGVFLLEFGYFYGAYLTAI